MLFDCFDRIRIVNLAHRTDRRREMRRQLARVGLAGDPRVAFFAAHAFADPGRFYSPGARGCFSSQMTLVEDAAAAGESLLILEDDCDFGAAIDACRVPAGCDVGLQRSIGDGRVVAHAKVRPQVGEVRYRRTPQRVFPRRRQNRSGDASMIEVVQILHGPSTSNDPGAFR